MVQVLKSGPEVRAAEDSCTGVYQLVRIFEMLIIEQHSFLSLYFSYKRDKARFTAAYPEYARGFTPLLNAIRLQQQERGDCEIRLTRRKNI